METTIAIAIIVALSTLGATCLQNWWSNKRFQQRLDREKAIESQRRRREVRSEPLLKLRAELANMATKLHTLVANTQEKKQQQALEDLRDYMTSEDFLQASYLQYDKKLLKMVEGIQNKYLLLFEYALDFKDLKADERKSFRQIFQEVKARIPEVQELINKRLEEL